jgi:Domain of unknown function (DUF6438)
MMLVLPAIASGCLASRSHPGDTDARGSVDSAAMADTMVMVLLGRGSCHGTCPVYRVSIGGNGQIQFVGTRFVKVSGRDSASIPAAAVRALAEAFAARKFASIPAEIEYGSAACGPYVADLSTVELQARSAAGLHRVRYDEGCRNHPAMLDTLARMVDSVSASIRWIGGAKP